MGCRYRVTKGQEESGICTAGLVGANCTDDSQFEECLVYQGKIAENDRRKSMEKNEETMQPVETQPVETVIFKSPHVLWAAVIVALGFIIGGGIIAEQMELDRTYVKPTPVAQAPARPPIELDSVEVKWIDGSTQIVRAEQDVDSLFVVDNKVVWFGGDLPPGRNGQPIQVWVKQ
jgi:hypothetical protein